MALWAGLEKSDGPGGEPVGRLKGVAATDRDTRRDPRQRFSGRVACYARYRPGYPRAVVETLAGECGLAPGAVVADAGSGTGILSKLLLGAGSRVFGVEPNKEMRRAAEESLRGYRRFRSVAGTAEDTTLHDRS